MKPTIIIFISILFFACKPKESEKTKSEKSKSQLSVFEPICYIQTEQTEYQSVYKKNVKILGDTLKIEFEYQGDTTIQKRIDLKGTSDDNWDSSFTIYTIWKTRKNSNLDCVKKISVKLNELNYYFCYKEALELIESEIADPDNWYKLKLLNKAKSIISNLDYQEEIGIVTDKQLNDYLVEKFIKKLEFTICDSNKTNEISFVRIGKYTTNFSGGYEYLIINRKNDTIEKFIRNEYMN